MLRALCAALLVLLSAGAKFGDASYPPLPREQGMALTFARPTTLTLQELRELCPWATGDLAVVDGDAWSLLSVGQNDTAVVPKGPVLCYTFSPERGVDFGVIYDFADVAGVSPAAPPRPSQAAFDKDVAYRLQELRDSAVSLLWYVIEVSDPATGRTAERIVLIDSGAGVSTFVGIGAELEVRAVGEQTIAASDGTELTSPWGHVLTRVLGRARRGPPVSIASGAVVQSWTREELSLHMQASPMHTLRTAARALFKGRASLLGFGALAAMSNASHSTGSLAVHPVHGIVQCPPCPTAAPLSPTATAVTASSLGAIIANEVWYEVLVTNLPTGQSKRYPALVDTGSAFSAFPATKASLSALPGGTSTTEHSAGLVHNSLLGVLHVRVLRRAHRLRSNYSFDADGNLDLAWVYDEPEPPAAPAGSEPDADSVVADTGVEVIARLDAQYGILGLNTLAALGLSLHPTRGLVRCCLPHLQPSLTGQSSSGSAAGCEERTEL